jgi:hypothetical protein
MIASREMFEKWELGLLKVGPGVVIISIDKDIRLVTANAIDAIIEMVSPAKPPPKKRRVGKDTPPPASDWVPCTQRDLLRANDINKRAGYAEYLKKQGVILEFRLKKPGPGIVAVIFAETQEGRDLKEKVLEVQAKKGGRKRRPKGSAKVE